MCLTCGCGSDDVHVEGDGHTHDHAGEHDHPHGHDHGEARWHTHADGTSHAHAYPDSHEPDSGPTHGHTHAHEADFAATPGMSRVRRIQVERDLLAANDAIARRNRAALAERGIFAVNLVSSPGSGKTSLLVRTIERLAGRLAVAVVEGDQQTSNDADRIRATGAAAIQINTGKGCHLDAAMVETALARLAPADDSIVMIETVGNLVCPAGFDLGEAHKVVVLSVTEGEDKPLKYPDMFQAASLMLLNKVDLLPHLDFDPGRCVDAARRVNPAIEIVEVSARTGQGLDQWLAWLERGAATARAERQATVAALRRRIAELEARLPGGASS
ncbi:MAG: hydrogenase nickel incorporation protein HypB [Caldimonas sp.]